MEGQAGARLERQQAEHAAALAGLHAQLQRAQGQLSQAGQRAASAQAQADSFQRCVMSALLAIWRSGLHGQFHPHCSEHWSLVCKEHISSSFAGCSAQLL